MDNIKVCKYVCIDGDFDGFICPLDEAVEIDGVFTYPDMDTVYEFFAERDCVDVNFYPRVRIDYRKKDDTYIVYYDKKIENHIYLIEEDYKNCKYDMICL